MDALTRQFAALDVNATSTPAERSVNELRMKIISSVFVNLTSDDIGSARLVNKTWQTTIDSLSLPTSGRWFIPDWKPQGRPIYSYVSGGCLRAGSLSGTLGTEASSRRPPQAGRDEVFDPANTAERTIVRVDFPWTLGEMLSWRDGKWKEALLTKPPRKEIRIQIVDGSAFLVFGSETRQSSHKYVDVANEEGTRMGDVVEALRKAAYCATSEEVTGEGGRQDAMGKTRRLTFSLERYRDLSFDIEPAVLPEGEWVEGAVEEQERARDC